MEQNCDNMKVSSRTDIKTLPFFDVRFVEQLLIGKYDNIYLIFSTLEDEPTDAWEDQGDSFLLINLSKEKVVDASVNYKDEIVKNLAKLSWLPSDDLSSYVHERWNHGMRSEG